MNRPNKTKYMTLSDMVSDATLQGKYMDDLENYCDYLESIINELNPEFIKKIEFKLIKRKLDKKIGKDERCVF